VLLFKYSPHFTRKSQRGGALVWFEGVV
jgi:hypothetical protein